MRACGVDTIILCVIGYHSFRRADRDGSGTIDSGELASILRDAGIELEPRMMERLMLKMDRNGDGVVSYEEFMLALRVGPHGNRQKRLLPVPMPMEAHPGLARSWRCRLPLSMADHITPPTTQARKARRWRCGPWRWCCRACSTTS
eukprot:COSAG01_NODE_1651_length_9623_cov_6.232045_12_plen_146_part_00